MAATGKVVETFPRPPFYYSEFTDSYIAQIQPPLLSSIDSISLVEHLYGSTFAEKSLTFIQPNANSSNLTHLQLKERLLELVDMISLQAGHIVNLKTVEAIHITEMKSSLLGMLEEFHGLLSHYRRKEAKVKLIAQLDQKCENMKGVKNDMER